MFGLKTHFTITSYKITAGLTFTRLAVILLSCYIELFYHFFKFFLGDYLYAEVVCFFQL